MIPRVTKHLLANPVFTCVTLAACMEIAVVAGFAAFLGKYLEQQFNLTTSSANQLLGECARCPLGRNQAKGLAQEPGPSAVRSRARFAGPGRLPGVLCRVPGTV